MHHEFMTLLARLYSNERRPPPRPGRAGRKRARFCRAPSASAAPTPTCCSAAAASSPPGRTPPWQYIYSQTNHACEPSDPTALPIHSHPARPLRSSTSASLGGSGDSATGCRRPEQGGELRRGVHEREGGKWRERLAGLCGVDAPPGRGDRRARKTRGRADARGAGGGAAEARPCAAGRRGPRRVGAAARGGGRGGARAPPQRGAGGEGPAGGRRVPGVDGRGPEPRGRRGRPPRHAGAAPAAAPRARRGLRGRRRGRAVVLLRGAGGGRGRRRRGRCRDVRVEDGVQVVRRRRGERAAAPVPAPVPVPRVRGRRGRVPRLRGRQERLAPRPLLLRRAVLVRGGTEDNGRLPPTCQVRRGRAPAFSPLGCHAARAPIICSVVKEDLWRKGNGARQTKNALFSRLRVGGARRES